MAITPEEIDQFRKRYSEIEKRYPHLLNDKERFRNLSKNRTFIDENLNLYPSMSGAWAEAISRPEDFPEDGFSNLIKHIEKFVERWGTPPVNCWLFDSVRPKTKIEMEEMCDSLGRFDTIKVYPWTTKEEVKEKYDLIREKKARIELNPESWLTNFRIKALRDHFWDWTDIMDFLSTGGESDQEYEARMKMREKELKEQGRTEKEIEEILDREFSYEDFDKTLEGITYDNVRMKKKAADNLIKRFFPY